MCTFMQRIETSLPGVVELRPEVFRDARGYFAETYHRDKFAEAGIKDCFVQDNHSSSRKGALRGLHYQLRHPQAKLCRAIQGEALDVVVDVRLGSPYFGKWSCVVLSAEKMNQVYVPPGFAHGFLSLSDRVQLLYKSSEFYHPEDEFGVLWNDQQLEISWNITAPLLSEKDSHLPVLSEISHQNLPQYPIK
jgi:dTDP-4-dehydrorhamnose 3,5-epimerase